MSAMCISEVLGKIVEPGLIDKQTLSDGRESAHFLVATGRLLISALSSQDLAPNGVRLFDIRCSRWRVFRVSACKLPLACLCLLSLPPCNVLAMYRP